MTTPEFPWGSISAALAVTTLMLWFGLPVARKIGWVDYPSARKTHKKITPLIGGIAMYSGYVIALALLDTAWPSWEIFLLISGITLIIGCLDDCWEVRARIRFLAECVIALMMVAWGEVVIDTLGDITGLGIIELGVWSVVFTMVSIVGVVNAVNMSDGLDGQAGGQSLVAFLALFFLAAHAGRWQEAWWMLLFGVVLLPFLWLNVPLRGDAKVFMGDSGSMFLGMTLAWFTISLSQGPHPAFTPVTALWLLAMPLIDMFSSILRRLMLGRPPFSSDLGHMHHLLSQAGYNKKQVFLMMVGLSALFSLVGVVALFLAVPETIMFYSLLVLFSGYCWLATHWRKYDHTMQNITPPSEASSPL